MMRITRKSGQKLRIGNNITITVTNLSNSRVDLIIEAPREIPLLRGEIESYGQMPDLTPTAPKTPPKTDKPSEPLKNLVRRRKQPPAGDAQPPG